MPKRLDIVLRFRHLGSGRNYDKAGGTNKAPTIIVLSTS